MANNKGEHEMRTVKRSMGTLVVPSFLVLTSAVLLMHGLAYGGGKKSKTLQLMPGYIEKIPGSSGVIEYTNNFKGAFKGKIILKGLSKGGYLLTVNENRQYPLKKKLDGWRKFGDEQYIDFDQIYVGDEGVYKGEIEVDLPPGKYTFKFFVKRIGGNYPSVLYTNFLKVKVSRSGSP